MAYDRFLIAPMKSGLRTDLKPWMIPDDAFAQLDNVYLFRGRIKKRFGSRLTGYGWTSDETAPLYSRLRIAVRDGGGALKTTDGAGAAAGFALGIASATFGFAVGQAFSIGDEIFTVTTAGAVQPMLATGASVVHTFSTTDGAYNFTGCAINTQIYFYPSLPVMALEQYETGTVNNQPTLAFDTRCVYRFTGGIWLRETIGAPLWHGTDLDFFWTTNWDGINSYETNLFASNFHVHNYNGVVDTTTDDPIWTYDGTTWSTFKPLFLLGGAGAGNYIVSTAKIIIGFKDRLLLLNTVETDNTAAPNTVNHHYPNRCRFSHNGSPFPVATAWLEPNQAGANGAGWIDAPTEEEIVSAACIKDRLIVYFERSTWELVYTENELLPFVWQKLNSELGSEATFSSVPFDKVVLTIGQTGIHACNGSNVERIDSDIPQVVFQIKDRDSGMARVAGVRDYYTENVYWSFPPGNQNTVEKYPNRVLVYNYKNNTWSFNDDCITSFGYFEQQLDDSWTAEDLQWQVADMTWNSGVIQAQFRQIVAGNQQGFVFYVEPAITRNASVMQITNMAYDVPSGLTTLHVIEHTLNPGDFVHIENTLSIPGLYKVNSVTDKDHFTVASAAPVAYTGGGTIARISKIKILTKQWNPYVDKGSNVHLGKIDFCVEKTDNGELTIDYYPSYTDLSMITQATANNSNMGTNVLETSPYAVEYAPLEQLQTQLWHTIYFQTQGEAVQLYISLNDAQMITETKVYADLELHGLVLHTQKAASRLA